MSDRFGFKPEYTPSAPLQQSDSHFTQGQPPFPQHNYHHQHPSVHFPPAPPHFHPRPPRPGGPPDCYPPNYPPPPGYYPSIEPQESCCSPSYPTPPGPQESCHPPNYPPPLGPQGSYPSYYPPPAGPQASGPSYYPPPLGPQDSCRPPNYPPPPGPPDGSYVVRGYYWVATNARQGVPPSAVRGGVDQDGTQIYVGRAHHEGDWIPAKVIPEKDVAYVAYGGKEHAKSEFQVLCEQTFEWVPTNGTNIPPEAVVGGQTSDGEPLYVGRVHHEGSHTVGKVHPSHGTCYIPFGGEELGFADYEILVLRG